MSQRWIRDLWLKTPALFISLFPRWKGWQQQIRNTDPEWIRHRITEVEVSEWTIKSSSSAKADSVDYVAQESIESGGTSVIAAPSSSFQFHLPAINSSPVLTQYSSSLLNHVVTSPWESICYGLSKAWGLPSSSLFQNNNNTFPRRVTSHLFLVIINFSMISICTMLQVRM